MYIHVHTFFFTNFISVIVFVFCFSEQYVGPVYHCSERQVAGTMIR